MDESRTQWLGTLLLVDDSAGTTKYQALGRRKYAADAFLGTHPGME